MKEIVDEVLGSPDAGDLVSALAAFAVYAGFAIYAHLSRRWVFLVPVARIARMLVEAAVAKQKADVDAKKAASGGKLLPQAAWNAQSEAVSEVERQAAAMGVSVAGTVGEDRLRAMVDEAVERLKGKAGAK